MGLARIAYQAIGWKKRHIDGHGYMTCTQFYVLREMVRCKQNGWPFIDLSALDARTVSALEERDYIFASKGEDGIRHSVTRRGETACRVYSLPLEKQRRDGLCPCCNMRPRARSRAGYRRPYCKECRNEYRNARDRGTVQIYGDPENPGGCPRCGVRKRQVFSSGRISPYCRACKMEIQFQRRV